MRDLQGTVLLSGTVGSRAYGLAHEGSDTDKLGVFAVPTKHLHGLYLHRAQESKVTKDPDVTLHEAVKWCRLALAGNPTVMELVWLPSELYDVMTPLGERLIEIRSAFLSASRVRDAYLGYATQQLRRLEADRDHLLNRQVSDRVKKHARHMYRLLMQGLVLWSTGALPIRLSHPDIVFSFGTRVALGDMSHARRIMAEFEHEFDTVPTVLPAEPDEKAVNDWLLDVREEFYTRRSDGVR